MKIEGNDQPWSKSPVEATPSLQETLTQRKMKEAPMGGGMGEGIMMPGSARIEDLNTPPPDSWWDQFGGKAKVDADRANANQGVVFDGGDWRSAVDRIKRENPLPPPNFPQPGDPPYRPWGTSTPEVSYGRPVPSGQEKPMIEGLSPVLAKLFGKAKY